MNDQQLFWNGKDRQPECRFFNEAEQAELDAAAVEELPHLLRAPFLEQDEIRHLQEARISELLRVTGQCEAYARPYACAGVRPESFKGLEDLHRFPIVSKRDFARVYPGGFPRISAEEAPRFKTYSSGSTSLTLPVHFSLDAVITDTLMGVRQLVLQSDGAVGPDDLAAHYYTYPWWTDNVARKWRAHFISSFNAPVEAKEILAGLQPAVVTGYASLISALAEVGTGSVISPKLVGVNSEQSTHAERLALSQHFGCPVLDEYSSEELTRIAYEMPDGFYYVNEDCVYLEVLDPVTRAPVPDGEWGEAVITGLLNDVMPFVRYATGDFVRRPKHPPPPHRGMTWSRLDGIGGRVLDSFVRRDGSIIPSGTILDVMYRAIADTDAAVARYNMIQKSSTEVSLCLLMASYARSNDRAAVLDSVRRSIDLVLGATVTISVSDNIESLSGKRRPIRRDFNPI